MTTFTTSNMKPKAKITDHFYTHYNKQYIEYQGCSDVSASECGRKYSIKNKSKKEIVKYKIDGGLINDPNEIKCDYGFYTKGDNNILFLVELKGSDYNHAIEQIINTIKLLVTEPKITVDKINARIVVSKARPPELRSSNEQKLRRILDTYGLDKDNLKKQSIQMTEII